MTLCDAHVFHSQQILFMKNLSFNRHHTLVIVFMGQVTVCYKAPPGAMLGC